MLEENDIVININTLKAMLFDELIKKVDETEGNEYDVYTLCIIYSEFMHFLKDYSIGN